MTGSPQAAPDTAPRYWTPLRERVAKWLDEVAPSLGELYRGALELVHTVVPGRVRFICHAVREIRNRLPDALAGEERGRTEYGHLTTRIAKEWEKSGLSLDSVLTPPNSPEANQVSGLPDVVTVPRSVLKAVAVLLRDHEAGSRRAQRRFDRLFDALAPENATQRTEMVPIVNQWKEVTRWFESRAHDDGKRDGEYDWKDLMDHFELFETSLGALAAGFFAGLEEVNALLDEANS